MKNARLRRALRLVSRAVLLSLVVTTLAGAAAFPFAGRFLVVDEPVQPADAIVVLAGSRAERWMEALDLYKDRIAPHIVLSSDRMEGAEFELRRRGIHLPRHSDLVREAMIQLGVPQEAVEVLPSAVDNTASEATDVRAIAIARGWKRLLVVTSKYHTRRARFAFLRASQSTGIDVRIRASRYDGAVPQKWWKYRSDVRYVLSELSKLLAYRLGLEG